VTEPNHRQFVITAFLLGFAFAQLVYGPLSDRFGRRPVLIIALVSLCAHQRARGDLGQLRPAADRAGGDGRGGGGRAGGDGGAGARLLRRAGDGAGDEPRVHRLHGRADLRADLRPGGARGGRIVADDLLGRGAAALVVAWFWLRMPETLDPDSRQSAPAEPDRRRLRPVLRDRTRWATRSRALLSGALFGFIGSVQQIMEVVFHRPELLTVVFATVASTMAMGSFLNSRIVMQIGTRRISHTALSALILFAAIHLAIAFSGHENLWTFAILQALMMASFGLATSNFSAMAMERMGEIAGTASSLQGFVATLGGALIGAQIGQSFNGTTVPLYMRFPRDGVLAFVVVAIAERGAAFPADPSRGTSRMWHDRRSRGDPAIPMSPKRTEDQAMGGYQVPGQGPGDDGFDEEGYDESQRAEILEATSDGPSDGNILTDSCPTSATIRTRTRTIS
jgi:DHA1 family bicyclomycin/chloramphenicol resistance-like MFS transporter